MTQADSVHGTPPLSTSTKIRRFLNHRVEPGYSRADALRHDAGSLACDVDGAMTGPIREGANPWPREDAKGSESLRDLLNSPREIVGEILDLTTLLGVLLAGDDAMRLIQLLWMRARLLLVRGCVKAGHFFAALGERLRGF